MLKEKQRKKRIALSVILVVIIVTALLFFVFEKANAPQKDGLVELEVYDPVYMALLEDQSLVYFTFREEGEGVAYFRRYIDGNITEIGTLPEFYLDTGSYIKLEDHIFFYAGVRGEEGCVENRLYGINLKTNTMEEYVQEKDQSVPGVHISKLGKNVAALKNIRNGNVITTFLSLYDIEAREEKRYFEVEYNEKTKCGEALYVCYGDGERLYLLKDIYDNEGNCRSKLLEYDRDLNLLREISLENKDVQYMIQKGALWEMRVEDSYIYLRNMSLERFLGKITEEGIETILLEKELYPCINMEKDDKQLYYIQRENALYQIECSTGEMEKIALESEYFEDVVLTYAICSREKVFFVTEDSDYTYNAHFEEREQLGKQRGKGR